MKNHDQVENVVMTTEEFLAFLRRNPVSEVVELQIEDGAVVLDSFGSSPFPHPMKLKSHLVLAKDWGQERVFFMMLPVTGSSHGGG